MTNDLPIGVFDSGVGGLTVLSALQQIMPNENFIYLGDTARVPYGTRSGQTIVRYSLRVAGHLMTQNIKALVVACNTATSYALKILQEVCIPLQVKVYGVIVPGALEACRATKTNKIAVLGTTGTVDGGVYPQTIHSVNPNVVVIQQACPLFVPLIEEGWHNKPVSKSIATEYLRNLPDVDTIILGCTHYPLLRNTLKKILPSVTFIDSARSTAQYVRKDLEKQNLLTSTSKGQVSFLVTDNLKRFRKVGYYFLEYTPSPLTLITTGMKPHFGVRRHQKNQRAKPPTSE